MKTFVAYLLALGVSVASAETIPLKDWLMDNHHQVSEEGSDRGTAYTVSGRIVRREDVLLIAWMDAPAAPGAPSRAMLGICDPRTGSLKRSFMLGTALDNHCGPSMVMDAGGRVHVVIGAHHGDFQYRWSDAPEQPDRWSEPEPLGPSSSYPSLVADAGGTLHLAYREQVDGYMGEQRWQLYYRRKPAGGSWLEPVSLAVSPVPGYNHFMQSLSVGPSGALHLTFQFHYSDTGRSADGWGRAAVHLRSDDGGDTWHNEGRRLDGPLTVAAMRPIGPPDRLPREKGLSISNHVVDQDDRPWLFASLPGHPSGVLWHLAGEGWRVVDLADALEGLRIGHGGSTSLSRDGAGRLHFVFPADPAGGDWRWGHPSLELFHAVFDAAGDRLALSRLTPDTPDAANWLPSLERWDWTHPALSFENGHWLLYTCGLNWSTSEHGRNRNAMQTGIFLGSIDSRP